MQSTSFFFLATLLIIYTKDDAQRQRTVNVLAEYPEPSLNKEALAGIQTAGISRIYTENNVLQENVQDVVILNLVCLGQMSEEDFYGPREQLDQAPTGTA